MFGGLLAALCGYVTSVETNSWPTSCHHAPWEKTEP